MSKPTKLTETAVRIPEVRGSRWSAALARYLTDIQKLNNESGRSHRFAMLVQELLGVNPDFIEAYSSGIEKALKVRDKDRLLRGRADNLFGNVIIEFEANIARKRLEAESQIRQYAAILWSQEVPDRRTPFLGIATDGVKSIAYTPTLRDPSAQIIDPNDVTLQLLEEADWTKLTADDVYYWLDRYFLRKEVLPPTGELIVRDFGVNSHAFRTTETALLSLWETVKTKSAFEVVYDSWAKYLLVVYGSKVAEEDLFIRHTYLATLAKLMAWVRLSGTDTLPDDRTILAMLEGRLFREQGIENFIEEDFFSWLGRGEAVPVATQVVRGLFSLLQHYNLRELHEDVLKSLYQELVDPVSRHDLGEYYTPDWLAHRIVNRLLDEKADGKMFDPSCGSGTFLYIAIREKRKRLGDSAQTLRHILDAVYGADVHPLAIIIAKTNYILALGDLLRRRPGSVALPVYLADTLRLPEQQANLSFDNPLPSYRVWLDGQPVSLPEALLHDLALYDHAIELASAFAQLHSGQRVQVDSFQRFLATSGFAEAQNDGLTEMLFSVAETLKQFMEADRDSIWAFVLKNIYKPLLFKTLVSANLGRVSALARGRVFR